MPDPTGEFFEQLRRRGHVPVLAEMYGTIRFDLRDERGVGHWFVEIRNGDVRVSRDVRPADCVVHTERAVFDQMVTGQLRHAPAWLRRLYWLEGDARLYRIFGMILPGPPGAHHPRDFVSNRRRGR